MFNLLNETAISLAEASRRPPRPVHLTTVWRWALDGIHGVMLETAHVGGRRVTSIEALARFFARLNGQPIKAARNGHHKKLGRELARVCV